MNALPETALAERRETMRDLEFDQHDFQRIRDLIFKRAGISLVENKSDMVYSRVGRRVRHHHLARFSDYLAQLERDPRSPEWDAFTNALTTTLTAFFREPHHFEILAQHVGKRRGPVKVWSAAASTGQEPYTIAMQLTETLGPTGEFDVLATDINTDALGVARHGVYPQAQIDKLGGERRKRFFLKGSGRHAGQARVRPELAARVRFDTANLIACPRPPQAPFDAIFCRNVMIYFDTDTQTRILRGLIANMKPDGLLFVGHSENFTRLSSELRLQGQTVYSLR